MLRVSYTKLDTYKQCPRKYKFYVEKTPQDPDKTLALRFGKAVHAALEFAYKNRYLPPALGEVLAFYDKLCDHRAGMEEVAQFEQGRIALQEYLEKNRPQDARVVAVEQKFSLPLDPAHEIVGVVDRIDLSPDGSFEIIDYKTSKLIADAEKLSRNWQLAIYQYVEQKKLQTNRIQTSLIYVMNGGHKLSYRFSQEELEEVKREVLTLIRRIEEDAAFPTRVGGWCHICPYQYLCPAWVHKYQITEDGLAPLRQDATVIDIRAKIDRLLRVASSVRELKNEEEQLKNIVREYAKSQDLTKLYSDLGSVAIRYGRRITFDTPRVIEVLEEELLRKIIKTIDAKKLENLIESLPPDAKQKVLGLRRVEETVAVVPNPKMASVPENETLTV